jgi:D-sorbitol dehydrogenase (acceptor)
VRLQDKVAIVTGAASGIGEAVTKRFLGEGAKVVVVDLKDEAELAQRFSDTPDRVLAIKADVTQREDIERIVASSVAKFGGIDILFNNAALFDMRPILDESWDIFDRLFSVNVKGMFFLMQRVAQRMVEQGRGGKIVNMSSQAGRRGEALVSHYCATKAAVISYTQSAALGLAKHGINVNSIAPGVVDTPMWETVDALFAKYENRPLGEKKRLVGEAVPLGRMGLPNDLTGAALFLVSADSDYITAQTLNVDGGNWMS